MTNHVASGCRRAPPPQILGPPRLASPRLAAHHSQRSSRLGTALLLPGPMSAGSALDFILSKTSSHPLVASVNKYFDACTCARDNKAQVAAIKLELEKKDAAISRLEEDLRRKDSEKDNLMRIQRDLQEQIQQIRAAIDAQALESEARAQAVARIDGAVPSVAEPFERADAPPMKSAAKPQQGSTQQSLVQQPLSVNADVTAEPAEQLEQPSLAKVGSLSEDQAAVKMQSRVRGSKGRARVNSRHQAAVRMQARRRGQVHRRLVEEKRAARLATGGTATVVGEELSEGALAELNEEMFMTPSDELGADLDHADDESIDSDYDHDDSQFNDLGMELLSGPLKLAKVRALLTRPTQHWA